MNEQHFGAKLTAEGVLFRLWAPAARRVDLLLDKPHALKRRSGLSKPPAASPARELPFVEVSLGAHRPTTAEVEIQRPDGMRLRITYRDAAPALAALVQTFLEQH